MASSGARRFNPIAFTHWPVTLITSLVYIALLTPLVVIQTVLPSAPDTSPKGLNLTEAWEDLQHLTAGFHPYNSRRNDEVHRWLLRRIDAILDSATNSYISADTIAPDVFVFDDNATNLTYSNAGVSKSSVVGVYFEGTNIVVYIRGRDDDKDTWWEDPDGVPIGSGGVLVNAHYDSVSTGYGATDDGVGVVTLLQLLKYFTTPGNAPRKGLVLLFNNGEEDFLNGAHAYSQHPLSKFTHTFLNLEGAGSGGRAALFRSTDTEVTKFYKNAKHPFGSVLAGDGFKMGLIRSETDYVVFNGVLGLRGLDVAFMEPRARYHTDQDDARHTNVDSVWHMLSAAIGTTKSLVSYSGSAFDGPTGNKEHVNSGTGTLGVWFDMFGSSFAVFQLHTLFAISVTLLIVSPLVLLVTSIILRRTDRMYLFAQYKSLEGSDEKVSLRGLRGIIRLPVIFVVTSAAVVALAYLLTKVNPFIVHSSQYAVWSMMISAWVFLAWFLSRAADFARPTVLQRTYGLTFIFIVMWVLLVINTVYVDQKGIAGGYFIFFYFAGTALATFVAYLELFSLPRQSDYALQLSSEHGEDIGSRLLTPGADEMGSDRPAQRNGIADEEDGDEEPTESTSLLRGPQRTTFANYRTSIQTDDGAEDDDRELRDSGVFSQEQQWSRGFPKWTWLLQFILIAPIAIVFVGQVGLFVSAAMHQVGADGVSLFTVYLGIALLSILLLLPLLPFVHRATYHIPTFLLLVFIGTLIYNLVAFPFSSANRLKLFFIQEVNLDDGSNKVSLTGMQPYVLDVINTIPSVAGQRVDCDSSSFGGRDKCSWNGIPPQVVDKDTMEESSGSWENWISFNISRTSDNEARFDVSGRNTRACKLKFDRPLLDYRVSGSTIDPRMPHTVPQGISEIRLWSRTWENTWTVYVEWENSNGASDQDDLMFSSNDGLSGRVICLWSDDNQADAIPALDEIRHYAAPWVAISKLSDGLVEGSHVFQI